MEEKLHGLCILVVEDEYLVADVFVQLIKLYGGTVAGPVATEEEALALLDAYPVDCALLDVKLSNGTCVALAEALARHDIHVTLTTGYPKAGIPQELRHLPTFTKPADLGALVEHLADCGRAKPSRNRAAEIPNAEQPEIAPARSTTG